MFAADFEVHRTNEAGTTSPRNHFLSLSFPDLKIVIDERSWVDRHCFPAFAHIHDCEIQEFDFLARAVFYTRPVRSFFFRCCISAADVTGKSPQASEEENESRIISQVSMKFANFSVKDGSNLSIVIQAKTELANAITGSHRPTSRSPARSLLIFRACRRRVIREETV